MALRWVDGFEVNRDHVSMARRYPDPEATQALNGSYISGRLNGAEGGLAYAAGNSLTRFQTPGFTPHATWVIGCALRGESIVNNLQWITLKSGTIEQASLRVTSVTDSTYKLSGFNSLGQNVSSSVTTLVSDQWYYIEFKVVVGASGSVQLDINEGFEFNQSTDTDAATGTGDRVEYRVQHQGGAGDLMHIDDMYIVDGSGTLNNDWQGDVVSEALRPNAVGSSSQWTRGGAGDPGDTSNYQRVDDVTPDDDSTYVTTNANSQKDLYGYSNPQFIQQGTPIIGVMVETQARLLSSGSRNIKTVSRTSGGAETQGNTLVIDSVAYKAVHQIWEQNPDGQEPGVPGPWDVDTLISHQFGFITVA